MHFKLTTNINNSKYESCLQYLLLVILQIIKVIPRAKAACSHYYVAIQSKMKEPVGKNLPTANPSATQLILRSTLFSSVKKMIAINDLFRYQLEITAGTLMIKINLQYFHISWFLNQILAALRIIHGWKNEATAAETHAISQTTTHRILQLLRNNQNFGARKSSTYSLDS